MPRPRPDVPLFWKIADAMIAEGRAEEGTMMGEVCLRTEGQFFASVGHTRDELIVKLPRDRVQTLIDDGIGQPFPPSGRPFKEWVAIPRSFSRRWRRLVEEAHAHASHGGR